MSAERSQPYAVVLVDDSEGDAFVIRRALEGAGIETTLHRVADEPGLREVLALGEWDAVLCDHNLPGFSSRQAIRIVRERDHVVPLILLSGSVSEAEIVAAMEHGASSFVSKDHLARLAPTLRNLIEGAADRRRHIAAQARLAELGAIVESSEDAIIATDLHGRVTSWNRGAERLYGWTAQEAVGVDISELVVPPSRQAEHADILASVARGETVRAFETERLAKAGAVRLVSLTVSPVFHSGEVVASAAIARDVTERKLADDAVRRSESRHRALLENLPDSSVIFFDEECRIVLAAGPLLAKGGSSESELVGRRLSDVMPSDTAAWHEAAYREALAGRRASREFRGARNPELTIAYDAVPVLDEAGSVAGGMVLARDITNQHRQQAELQAARRLFQEAFENAPIGMAMVSATPPEAGRYTRVNGAFASMVGWSPKDLVGKRPAELTHPADIENTNTEIGRMLAGELEQLSEKRYLRPDGSVTWALPTGRLVRDADGQPMYALEVIADITAHVEAREQKSRLETMLHQAQKLEGIGRLAGGIAHDFNNLLAVILNYAELAKDEALTEEALGEISRAGQRAADLTNRLLVFSRQEMAEPVALGLNTLVRDMEKFLSRTIGEDIDLRLKLAAQEPFVTCDTTQLEQSLLNLAINARDAMPAGGSITIGTGTRTVAEAEAQAHSIDPGEYAELRVADDGAGMDPDVLEHACEPFFTTKAAGQGTGLGLAMVYGCATGGGGTVLLESSTGAGTIARVLLPLADRTAGGNGPEPPPKLEPAATERRVLVVEDEPAVRRLIERILGASGYEVIVATEAAEALEIHERDPSIDIVLTDVVMPGMSGPDLAEELAVRGSRARVLFMTGYTDRPARIPADAPVLRKPFDAQGLQRHLADL